MPFAAKLDELGKPAWIAAVILGFIVFWPLGVLTLAYLFWSGRMTCNTERAGWAGFGGRMGSWRGRCGTSFRGASFHRSSGNSAFDEYRNETLKRLEEEEREFQDFLAKLRAAKDKAEFDQFMSERKTRGPNPGDVVEQV
ncbi:DUF2852 domain-containing protein [Terrihabitans sp. B22-R8]|uniref:DUF2852 domain-containing protein n=1 Tax=Terrihabitans sp. B22-R8 TaxID=3425128 RepID=UPI00403C1836